MAADTMNIERRVLIQRLEEAALHLNSNGMVFLCTSCDLVMSAFDVLKHVELLRDAAAMLRQAREA